MLVLFADTDTDMTPEIAEKYGYRIISMPYVIDGKETAPYEDFEVFDSHAFYDRLRGERSRARARSAKNATAAISSRCSRTGTTSCTSISRQR